MIKFDKMAEILTLYVSPDGQDNWTGQLETPNEARDDGPLATPEGARNRLRRIVQSGTLIDLAQVLLREGTYPLATPLAFSPVDSFPVSYEAYPGEKPVVHGGIRVTDWTSCKINSIDALVADVGFHISQYGAFNTLFINGMRRERARYPKGDTLPVAGVPGRPEGNHLYKGARHYFDFEKGHLPEWSRIDDAEVVAKHLWLEERLPIASIDYQEGRIHCRRESVFSLDAFGEEADFWIENVFEELTEPGEWYLDRSTSRLYYIPMEGEPEDSLDAIIPVLSTLVRFEGSPEDKQLVSNIKLKGITFRYTDWSLYTNWDCIHDPDVRDECKRPDPAAFDVPGFEKRKDRLTSSVPQTAANLPGVIHMMGARNCRIEDCSIRDTGFWGIRIGEGCSGVIIRGNNLNNTGAGGVLISGGGPKSNLCNRTSGHLVCDNEISFGGRVFMSSAGVSVTHGQRIEISHNHVHDYYYTGISAGWTWGYSESGTREVLIYGNHIHEIGCGYLSDMGAIYTLGIQPGTEIRNNVIHDVRSKLYGGWGVYLDEGSSHMIIEGNLIFNTGSSGLNMHYGRENIFRNNVVAYCGEGAVSLGRSEGHVAATVERNVLVSENFVFFWQGYGAKLVERPIRSDLNLFLQATDGEYELETGFCSRSPDTFPIEKDAIPVAGYSDWNALGNDCHSIVDTINGAPSKDELLNALNGLAKSKDVLGIADCSPDEAGVRPVHSRVPVRNPLGKSEDYYLSEV